MRKTCKRYLILFDSKLVTVKSVYRRKLDSKVFIYLHFFEIDTSYSFQTDSTNTYPFLRKGQVVTLHLGNGGYIAIEDGNKVPKDGIIAMKL